MKANAPKKLTLLIALILAGVSLVGIFVTIPFVTVYAFWILFVAFCVLAAGCLFKGL